MRDRLNKLVEHLPLQLRVLYRQFLLRVVDLEALSIETNVSRILGQVAGILVLYGSCVAIDLLVESSEPWMTPAGRVVLEWRREQNLIATMLLVVGLIAVISWDSAFPDHRDVMVLSPLPVRPRMILLAKMAAAGAVLAVAVLALSLVPGAALAFVMGGIPHFFPIFAAWLLTVSAASVFLYCVVLTAQGFAALLPRRAFLRLSGLLQLAAFGIFPAVYFLEPSFLKPAAMLLPKDRPVAAALPTFWFFALFNQLTGRLPAGLAWLASRACIALGLAVTGAAIVMLLCYLHTMKKTVEEPYLAPGARSLHWPQLGGRLRSAILLFSLRSLARSRLHRLVLSFYFALVFAFALFWLRSDLSASALRPLSMSFLLSTFMMLVLAVFGLRSVFSLPISLTANWIWRITQLSPPQNYIAGTRWCVLVLAVIPAWLLAAALSPVFRPWQHVAAHLVMLALLGCILGEVSLIGLYKIPFTCSYLPGKANVQLLFWGFLFLTLVLGASFANLELRLLDHPLHYFEALAVLAALYAGLRFFNGVCARSAVLYYEELPDEVITSLRLVINPASPPKPK